MNERVEFVADLIFPGIGEIKFAGNRIYKTRQPTLSFEIAGQKVDFRIYDETDGGTSETPNEKVYTRRIKYKLMRDDSTVFKEK